MVGRVQNSTDADAVSRIIEEWHRQRPDLDPSPIEVLGRLHRSFLLYQSRTSKPVAAAGLSLAGFDVLAALRRSGEPYRLTAGELAATSLISSAGVTLRLDRLEGDGLIVRERDVKDRRVVHCRLTPAGLKLIDTLLAEYLENERSMLAGLKPKERVQLAALLQKLERSLGSTAGSTAGVVALAGC
ncbi:transcriptional regulator [Streptomyces viridosporus ATCC 14672]|uniref:Transcriptional regulator n=1 Tax=Streptomyces viridosporus (strain ATCC 14672 / DSM 40746 / JCM 4963 / KCTC 9882 / NRRL B-12104 / FH 1290) TaxID=566461 RepID=D6A5F0_STRV1|nr:MarR family transcriptional regulator [Streptomyces viridosporus]EFE71662.1 transcriptional regulator [Streptomyces viridosporus ATCC 14672]